MAKDTQDSIAFLEEAREALSEIESKKVRCGRLQAEEKRLQRTLSAEKKSVEDTIASTVGKRKEEITVRYDKEITKTQEKLKKARQKRDKAKEKGIKARKNSETAQLREENRQLKEANITSFRKNKIPAFCNSKVYFALYFTKNITDFLILLLSFAIGFVGLPCAVYFLIPKRNLLILVIIYVVDILVLLLLYIGLNNRTKVEHLEVMKEVRKNRDMIDANNRKIRVIMKTIERDENEDHYKLDRYDNEIREVEAELEEVADRKQEALTSFENETQYELDQEIRENNAAKLEELSRQVKETAQRAKNMSDDIKDRTREFNEQYAPYINQEFQDPEKLERLAEIIRQGLASSISEAQQIYKDVK